MNRGQIVQDDFRLNRKQGNSNDLSRRQDDWCDYRLNRGQDVRADLRLNKGQNFQCYLRPVVLGIRHE